MSLNFGVTKNADPANNGAFATFSDINVTGVPNPVAETFAGPALSAFWRRALNDPVGLWFVPADTAQWLTWNLPDSGFNLQSASAVNGPWTSLVPPNMYQGTTAKFVPISAASMTSGSAFFRLVNSGQ